MLLLLIVVHGSMPVFLNQQKWKEILITYHLYLVLPKLSEQQRKNDVIVVDADSNVQATVEVCFYIYIVFNFHISLIMLDQFSEQPDVSLQWSNS